MFKNKKKTMHYDLSLLCLFIYDAYSKGKIINIIGITYVDNVLSILKMEREFCKACAITQGIIEPLLYTIIANKYPIENAYPI